MGLLPSECRVRGGCRLVGAHAEKLVVPRATGKIVPLLGATNDWSPRFFPWQYGKPRTGIYGYAEFSPNDGRAGGSPKVRVMVVRRKGACAPRGPGPDARREGRISHRCPLPHSVAMLTSGGSGASRGGRGCGCGRLLISKDRHVAPNAKGGWDVKEPAGNQRCTGWWNLFRVGRHLLELSTIECYDRVPSLSGMRPCVKRPARRRSWGPVPDGRQVDISHRIWSVTSLKSRTVRRLAHPQHQPHATDTGQNPPLHESPRFSDVVSNAGLLSVVR
jgi:hypothetical protein